MKIRIKNTRGKMQLPQTRLTALDGDEYLRMAASRIPDQKALDLIVQGIPADQRQAAYEQVAPFLKFDATEPPSLSLP